MAKIIELKTLPEYFDAVDSGKKTHELRYDDRNYAVGDILILHEWKNGEYLKRRLCVKITHILKDCELGLKEGWAILSIKRLREVKRKC